MVAPNAAYKHTLVSGGDVQRKNPGFFSQTPSGMITAGTAYTAGQLTTVSTDDTNFVGNSLAVPSGTTGRSNHLFEFDVASPGSLTGIFNTVTFSHLISGNNTKHGVRTYIWDANLLVWEQIAASLASAVPRTMSGSANGPTFSDYVDGSNKLYILIWDREAVFQTGGGCVHAETMISTTDGMVLISALRPGQVIHGWIKTEPVERKVEEITNRWPAPHTMVYITTASYGAMRVTDNHLLPTSQGEKRAGELTTSDDVLGLDSEWHPITTIEHKEENGHVYDLVAGFGSFRVDGGMAVGVMNTE